MQKTSAHTWTSTSSTIPCIAPTRCARVQCTRPMNFFLPSSSSRSAISESGGLIFPHLPFFSQEVKGESGSVVTKKFKNFKEKVSQSESSEKEPMKEKNRCGGTRPYPRSFTAFKKACSVLWPVRIRPRNAAA